MPALAGMAAVVQKMVARLKDYQATAVHPVRPEGCNPVIDERDAWRPCDSPEVCFATRTTILRSKRKEITGLARHASTTLLLEIASNPIIHPADLSLCISL